MAALLFDCTKKRFCVTVTLRRSFLGKFHILFFGVSKLIPIFAIDMCVIASVLTLAAWFELEIILLLTKYYNYETKTFTQNNASAIRPDSRKFERVGSGCDN